VGCGDPALKSGTTAHAEILTFGFGFGALYARHRHLKQQQHNIRNRKYFYRFISKADIWSIRISIKELYSHAYRVSLKHYLKIIFHGSRLEKCKHQQFKN
jgi:hypothetical protein